MEGQRVIDGRTYTRVGVKLGSGEARFLADYLKEQSTKARLVRRGHLFDVYAELSSKR